MIVFFKTLEVNEPEELAMKKQTNFYILSSKESNALSRPEIRRNTVNLGIWKFSHVFDI